MPELVVPRIGLCQRSFKIVMKYDPLLIRRLEATSQHNSIRRVLPEIHVVPAINRRHDKAQFFYIWGHGRKRRVPIAELIEPPIKIASSIPTGGLVKSANSEDHLATTAMKFLGDLRAGRAAAYNQRGTSRHLRGVSIVA